MLFISWQYSRFHKVENYINNDSIFLGLISTCWITMRSQWQNRDRQKMTHMIVGRCSYCADSTVYVIGYCVHFIDLSWGKNVLKKLLLCWVRNTEFRKLFEILERFYEPCLVAVIIVIWKSTGGSFELMCTNIKNAREHDKIAMYSPLFIADAET